MINEKELTGFEEKKLSVVGHYGVAHKSNLDSLKQLLTHEIDFNQDFEDFKYNNGKEKERIPDRDVSIVYDETRNIYVSTQEILRNTNKRKKQLARKKKAKKNHKNK